MCGIAGFHVLERKGRRVSLAPMSREMLRAIEHRGRDATGAMCVMDDGEAWLRKDTVPASKFIRTGRTFARGARTTILHTRWATKGSPRDVRNAHPIVVDGIGMVHNGVLWNDDEVFQCFDLPRQGEVDSEAIPALIALAGWEHAADALALLDGTFAIAAVNQAKPSEVILARSYSSPLVYAEVDGIVAWASTKLALADGLWSAGLGDVDNRKEFPTSPVRYLPEMHLVRMVDGYVGEPERFAPDKKYSYSYETTTSSKSKKAGNHRPKAKHRPAGTRTFADERDQSRELRDWLAGRAPFNPKRDDRPSGLSIADDVAIDLLLSEGFTLDEAIGIIRDENRIAREWRDGVWEDVVWDEDDIATPVALLTAGSAAGENVHVLRPGADDGTVVHGQRRATGGMVHSKTEATLREEALMTPGRRARRSRSL